MSRTRVSSGIGRKNIKINYSDTVKIIYIVTKLQSQRTHGYCSFAMQPLRRGSLMVCGVGHGNDAYFKCTIRIEIPTLEDYTKYSMSYILVINYVFFILVHIILLLKLFYESFLSNR